MPLAKTHLHKNAFDCLIILGAGQHDSGKPDKESLTRLSKGIELFSQRFASRLLLCGGRINKKAPLSLARALQKEAVAKKNKPKNILLDEQSLDTLGNAVFSKLLVQKNRWNHLLLVTSDYHLERALYLFHHVYGAKYTIAGIDVETGIVKHALRQRHEQRYLLALEAFLAGIKPGDHKRILQKMRRSHPLYMPEGPKRHLLQRFLEELRQ